MAPGIARVVLQQLTRQHTLFKLFNEDMLVLTFMLGMKREFVTI